MPYRVAEFDESRQEAFIETVADAANVPSFRVEITSITEATGRRLLAQGCEVLFRVRVPIGEETEDIIEALSFENVNMGLEQGGLQPAQRLATPARIFRTLTCGGGCAADCSPSSARSGTLHLGEGMFSGSGSAGSGDVYLNDQ